MNVAPLHQPIASLKSSFPLQPAAPSCTNPFSIDKPARETITYHPPQSLHKRREATYQKGQLPVYVAALLNFQLKFDK
jgi:hypothetical protein